MWISQQISKSSEEPVISSGKATLNDSGNLEAVSTGVERNVEVYSPYGYSYSLPMGAKLLLARCDGQQKAIGVRTECDEVKVGEIKISAASGSYIHLRDDGSVVINGLVISKAGEINEQND